MRITLSTPSFTDFFRSASSRMMLADLPPSSWCTRLTVSAAALATRMPARVEPVKETMSTPGWREMASPTVGPSPLTRLNTPFGTPASSIASAKMMALSGAISEGFSTMVQPAASAGATLHMIWLSGQFHGVIMPTTPIGSLAIKVVPRSSSNSKFSSVSIILARWAVPMAACARCASSFGAPISRDRILAMSS